MRKEDEPPCFCPPTGHEPTCKRCEDPSPLPPPPEAGTRIAALTPTPRAIPAVTARPYPVVETRRPHPSLVEWFSLALAANGRAATLLVGMMAAVVGGVVLVGLSSSSAETMEVTTVDGIGEVRCKEVPAIKHTVQKRVAWTCPEGGTFVCAASRCHIIEAGDETEWRTVGYRDTPQLASQVDYFLVAGKRPTEFGGAE